MIPSRRVSSLNISTKIHVLEHYLEKEVEGQIKDAIRHLAKEISALKQENRDLRKRLEDDGK